MKKIIIILCFTLLIFSTACGTTYQEAMNSDIENTDFANGYFTIITEWTDSTKGYKIVYANDTKVKYLIINGSKTLGITPLYNEDGTLQLYEVEEQNTIKE